MNEWNNNQNPGFGGSPGLAGGAHVQGKVSGPATAMMVVAGIGALFALLGLGMNILGMGAGLLQSSQMGSEQMMVNMFSGTFGIVQSIVGLLMAGAIIYGSLQMKKLTNYGIAVGVSILICVPFCSPCCLLGLPVGIWSLVVLMDDDVKAAFR